MHLNNAAWEKEQVPEWDLRYFLQSWWIRCLPSTRAQWMNTPKRAASAWQGYGWIGEDRLRRVWLWWGSGGVGGHCFGMPTNNGKRLDNEGGALMGKNSKSQGRMWSKSLKMSLNSDLLQTYFAMAPCCSLGDWDWSKFLRSQKTDK